MINTVRSGRSKRLRQYANTPIRRCAMHAQWPSISVEQIAAYFSLPQIWLKEKTEQFEKHLLHRHLSKQHDVKSSPGWWSFYKDAGCALSGQACLPSHPVTGILNNLQPNWISLANMILVSASALAFSLAFYARQAYATPLANTFPPYNPPSHGDGMSLMLSSY